jgi:hypothetical protein
MAANVTVERLTAISISNNPCPLHTKLTAKPGFFPKNFVATLLQVKIIRFLSVRVRPGMKKFNESAFVLLHGKQKASI